MALSSDRRRGRGGLDAWPGYVDALSTLLMVIIFVLLVFVLAQGFLSVALSSRDRALDRLNRQVSELAELLSIERGQAEELRSSLGRTVEELNAAASARDTALRQLGLVQEERDRLSAERDAALAERERLVARIADLEVATRGAGERVTTLERQLAEALARAEAAGTDAARTVRELTEVRRTLAQVQAARESAEARGTETETQLRATLAELAESQAALEQARREMQAMREAAAELDREVQVGRETIEARLSDIARLSEQVRALEALRDQLERQAEAALARAEAEQEQRRTAEIARTDALARIGAAEAQAAEHVRLAESARAQVALLRQELEAVRAELARLSSALDIAEASGRDKDAQIANLGQRLNAALAARVEELQRYRSDFFGRLRQVLGERPEVRIVGDRFVFQSEVLFPAGSAELTPRGEAEIRNIAGVLKEIASQIPPDVNWVLRVDGHADRQPIRTARFANNWELSAARAIAVAQLLIREGLPANRVAATAFGDTQPIDPADTPEAYARNRRIELRLTDR